MSGMKDNCTTQILLSFYVDPRDLHSFPTRRSSDLLHRDRARYCLGHASDRLPRAAAALAAGTCRGSVDRKSTRNSSHSQISYAVFCLKKKTPLRFSPPTVTRPYCTIASVHV